MTDPSLPGHREPLPDDWTVMLELESAASAPGPPPGPVTTTTAMTWLGCNRDQVVRLVATGLLPELGRRGRTRLLDPAALAALARRPVLPDAGADQSGAETYALALHLGPRAAEERPDLYDRDSHGYYADRSTPDSAWTGWWNTGEQIARAAVAGGLPVLPAVSGFVVDVRVLTEFEVHPLYPGLIRFDLAPPAESVRARFQGRGCVHLHPRRQDLRGGHR